MSELVSPKISEGAADGLIVTETCKPRAVLELCQLNVSAYAQIGAISYWGDAGSPVTAPNDPGSKEFPKCEARNEAYRVTPRLLRPL